jgi:hypothetical protein
MPSKKSNIAAIPIKYAAGIKNFSPESAKNTDKLPASRFNEVMKLGMVKYFILFSAIPFDFFFSSMC